MQGHLTRSVGLFAIMVLAGAVLGGCESARKAFGGGKNAPDEFVVYKRPPLSLPPEFDLRPPEPGTDRPQRITPADDARRAIMGDDRATTQQGLPQNRVSPGLQALITRTGANKTEPNIRRLVDRESSVLADEDQLFVNKLIFWADDTTPQGTVVDATKERQRIMSNQALGKSITEGETPKIRRKPARKGLLNF